MASSAGPEAVELAATCGLVLDDWQAAFLSDALSERANGRWAALEVGLIVPRQNGKGSVLEARELAGLFLFKERLILHSAQLYNTAQEAFRRLVFLIQSNPELDKMVHKIRTANGEQGIELRTGERIRFMARSAHSGRGFTGDCIVLDEAYNLSPEGMAAMFPTLSARPNPQLWYTSSAPLQTPESYVLRRFCRRGRAGGEGMVYVEYSADPNADVSDPAAWLAANPALGIRLEEEFVAQERDVLLDEFDRERLGWWVDTEDEAVRVVPAATWDACRDVASGPTDPVAFAVDVSPSRDTATIAVAGAAQAGGTHVEIVDERPGTEWVVARCLELQAEWGGRVAVAAGSPAASLIPELVLAGVDVLEVSGTDHARACGAFFDACEQRKLRHLGQTALDRAVAGADRRFNGDAWLWSRRTSATNITPLVAVTLAMWAHEQSGGVTVWDLAAL